MLHSMKKSHAVLLQPSWNHPFLLSVSTVYAPGPSLSLCGQLSYQIDCLGVAVFAFKKPLFYLIMAPKHKNSDTGSSALPKRSHKVPPLSEKAYMLRKKHSMYKVSTVCGFWHPLGVLEHIPCG